MKFFKALPFDKKNVSLKLSTQIATQLIPVEIHLSLRSQSWHVTMPELAPGWALWEQLSINLERKPNSLMNYL